MSKISIQRTWNEDSVDIVIQNGDKELIFNANHDDHGWGGMHSLEEFAKGIAEVLGVDFEDVYLEGDD